MTSDRSMDRAIERGGKSEPGLDEPGASDDGEKSGGLVLNPDPAPGEAPDAEEWLTSVPADEHAALFACMELLFFAYRDFTSGPDALLEKYKFGRAHHRVLHFVSRNPGLRVADLLEILRITKQSLARVLKQLVDEGFIVQEAGKTDRRERHLFVTERGKTLAGQLADLQMKRLHNALSTAGPGAEQMLRSFFLAMIGDDQRKLVARLIDKTGELDTPA